MRRSTFQLHSLHPKATSYTVISERLTGNEIAHDSLSGSQGSPHCQIFPNYAGEGIPNASENPVQRPLQDYPSVLYAAPWLPGAFKCVPWLGLCALGISVFCMTVLIGVLVKSNGQPVVYWPV